MNIIRLMLDPAADGGGQPPQVAPPPEADPIKALLAEKVAEARSLKEQLDAVAKTQAEREAEAERQRLALLAAKEGAEKALEEQRLALERRAAELEARARETQDRYLQAELTRALAQALSVHTWLDGGQETAARLLRDELEARLNPAGGVEVVHRATGLPAAQYVAEALARPPYTHLIAAPSKGGSGATTPPPPGRASGPGESANPVEAALQRAYLARLGQTPGIPGFGRPRS